MDYEKRCVAHAKIIHKDTKRQIKAHLSNQMNLILSL